MHFSKLIQARPVALIWNVSEKDVDFSYLRVTVLASIWKTAVRVGFSPAWQPGMTRHQTTPSTTTSECRATPG